MILVRNVARLGPPRDQSTQTLRYALDAEGLFEGKLEEVWFVARPGEERMGTS